MHSGLASCAALALALVAQTTGLTGCASTPQATHERDAQAKQFGSAPDTAAVYIYRTDTAVDDSVLWIDGRLIGSTLPRAYFRIHLDPGDHVLTGFAADNGRFKLQTRPGEVYFISLNLATGQSHFRLVPEATGRKAVTYCCSLLENWAPGQRPLLR